MLRENKYIEITVCDEGCIPYDEPYNKEDEEWNPLQERYERPRKVNYKRKFIYHCSFVACIFAMGGIMLWTYDILNKYAIM